MVGPVPKEHGSLMKEHQPGMLGLFLCYTKVFVNSTLQDFPLVAPPKFSMTGCLDAKVRLIQNASASHPIGTHLLHLCRPSGNSSADRANNESCYPLMVLREALMLAEAR